MKGFGGQIRKGEMMQLYYNLKNKRKKVISVPKLMVASDSLCSEAGLELLILMLSHLESWDYRHVP